MPPRDDCVGPEWSLHPGTASAELVRILPSVQGSLQENEDLESFLVYVALWSSNPETPFRLLELTVHSELQSWQATRLEEEGPARSS